jgi:hypothetical protein
MDVIEKVRATLADRLGELEQESERLRSALKSLDGRGNRQRAQPRGPQGRPSRRKTSPGDERKLGKRQEQFLAAVRRKPGAGVPELAKSIGVRPEQGYSIAKSLSKRGRIRKSGKGYALRS